MTSTPTRPVDNVVITTKGLQDRNVSILGGSTVENKGKLILNEIFSSLQIMIFLVLVNGSTIISERNLLLLKTG